MVHKTGKALPLYPLIPRRFQAMDTSLMHEAQACSPPDTTRALAFVPLGHPDPAGNKHGGKERLGQLQALARLVLSRAAGSQTWQKDHELQCLYCLCQSSRKPSLRLLILLREKGRSLVLVQALLPHNRRDSYPESPIFSF